MSSLYKIHNSPALPERFIPPGVNLNELPTDFYDAEKQYDRGMEYLSQMRSIDDIFAKKAFVCFQNAAYFEDGDAAYQMGWHYLFGVAVEKSAKKAQICFLNAAAKNCPEAYYRLGILCEEKLPAGQSDRQALGYFMMAGDLGHNKALMRCAEIFEQGLGVEQSDSEAFYKYETAAIQGNTEAQFKVAEMCAFGKGIEFSEEMTIDWMNQAVASQAALDALLDGHK